jgi:hypothetical protein
MFESEDQFAPPWEVKNIVMEYLEWPWRSSAARGGSPIPSHTLSSYGYILMCFHFLTYHWATQMKGLSSMPIDELSILAKEPNTIT